MDSPEAKSPSSSCLEPSPSRGGADYDLDTDRRLIFPCERVEKQLAEVEKALKEISLDENLSDDEYDSMEDYLEDLINSYSYYKEHFENTYWTVKSKMGRKCKESSLFESDMGIKTETRVPGKNIKLIKWVPVIDRTKLVENATVVHMVVRCGERQRIGPKYKLVQKFGKGELHEEYRKHFNDLEEQINDLDAKSREYIRLREEESFLLGIRNGEISDDLYDKAEAMKRKRRKRPGKTRAQRRHSAAASGHYRRRYPGRGKGLVDLRF